MQAHDLFTAVRSLGRGHACARLIDVYTYTTIISQCESADAIERAFDLVHSMQADGIEPNVHTYSALMKARALSLRRLLRLMRRR